MACCYSTKALLPVIARCWSDGHWASGDADSPAEEVGFEPSVPRVMDGDSGRQVPTLIAVFKLAGTAVALQRGTKVVRPDRHPEFR